MVPAPVKVVTPVRSEVFVDLGSAEADLVVDGNAPADQDRRASRGGRLRQGGNPAVGAVPLVGEVVLPARGRGRAVREAARAVRGVVRPAFAGVLAGAGTGLPDVDALPVVHELVAGDEDLVLVAAAGNLETSRAIEVHRAVAVVPARARALSPAAVHEKVARDVQVEAGLAGDGRAVAPVEVIAGDERAGVPVVEPDRAPAARAVVNERVGDDVGVERAPPFSTA